MVIYLNVLSSQNKGQKLRSFFAAQEILRGASEGTQFLDEKFTYKGLDIVKTCMQYHQNEKLVQVQIMEKNEDGKLLWRQIQLIPKE